MDRVRELYHKRVDDVRFLIPVLPGLSKKEVISALPQLIKLNPIVVKEVINRSVFCFRGMLCYIMAFCNREIRVLLQVVESASERVAATSAISVRASGCAAQHRHQQVRHEDHHQR